MSARLTDFYGVRRLGARTIQKRPKLSPELAKNQPKTRKPKLTCLTESGNGQKKQETGSTESAHSQLPYNVPKSDDSSVKAHEPRRPLSNSALLRVPAHKKFSHLAQRDGPVFHRRLTSDAEGKPDLTSTTKAPIVLSGRCTPTKLSVTCPSAAFKTDESGLLEAVKSGLSSTLPLPSHMHTLLEFFRACDLVVSVLHNRSEVCSFDKVKLAVQELVRSDFTEAIVSQFATVYPDSYSFRYDKQLDKVTKLPTSSYVLILIPNLRSDGTQMARDSPSKGHLVFTGNRLIQRRHHFQKSLIARVRRAHREFLVNKLSISESDLPPDSPIKRWHPAFPLDTAVPTIPSTPLPPKPDANESKITSASEAVAAFRSRALFREAEICERFSPHPQDAKKTYKSVVPSPSQASGSLTKSNAVALKGISESLLARVREREKAMQFSLLTRSPISEKQRLALSCLPTTITQVWRELRALSGKPVPLATVATRLAQSSETGLSQEAALYRIDELISLMPDWLEKVAWAKPHLRLKDMDRPLKDVIDEAKRRVVEKGIV
ncbi:unnamed protein product [Schistocephalus solidus]|uniref:DNA replication factor Cdt1 n=2 Tax=Schistocephalus solidus TaxID=70667 RepID=A0A183TKL1_SCHSO|nr:unnamed protein product [Schistocephalus solidus]